MKKGEHGAARRRGGPIAANIAIVLVVLLLIVGALLTYDTEDQWIGHTITALTGLTFITWIMVSGSVLSGRLQRRGKSTNTFGTHRRLSIWFAITMVATFSFGLWARLQHQEPLLGTVHGWLGLAIAVLAILQVVPSLLVKSRKALRRPHRLVGFSLVLLLTLQVAYGTYVAALERFDPLVLAHSISGSVVALALVWIIVEVSHLKERGVHRAKMAGYIAATFSVLGCWVVGGYNYLFTYRSAVRPVILAGDQAWAHQVVMEAKEHIFLFLPLITIVMAVSIASFGHGDSLLKSSQARWVVVALAAASLVMVVIMFLMGFLISSAGSVGSGAG